MKKIILSEVNRIHEIMGLKKSLIMEGLNPLKTLFGKMGIEFEELMSQMESMSGRMESAFGQRYMEKIKALFEKEMLSIEEREFVAALTVKAFPNTTKKFVTNIEQVLLKNNSSEIDGILQLFQNKNIPTIDIAEKVLNQRLGIKMTPESLELWRSYREINIPIGIGHREGFINSIEQVMNKPVGNRTPPTQTTNVSSVATSKPTTQVNTTSVNTTPVTKSIENSLSGGKILEPHEFTVEGTNAGYQVYKGDKSNALGDIRQETFESIKDNYTKESVINGKKVFTLVNTTQKDYVGRSGYASVSISLPLNTKLTINDVLPELQNRMKMEQSPGGSMYNEFMRNRLK
jgi:hypothetical protein